MLRVIEFQQIVLIKLFLADGIDYQPAAGSQIFQRFYDRFPGRGGVDDAVQLLRWFIFGITGSDRTQFAGKFSFLSTAGKDINCTIGESVHYRF